MLGRCQGFLDNNAVLALHPIDAVIDPARVNGRRILDLLQVAGNARVQLLARFGQRLRRASMRESADFSRAANASVSAGNVAPTRR
jgi:hypothetical protein